MQNRFTYLRYTASFNEDCEPWQYFAIKQIKRANQSKTKTKTKKMAIRFINWKCSLFQDLAGMRGKTWCLFSMTSLTGCNNSLIYAALPEP